MEHFFLAMSFGTAIMWVIILLAILIAWTIGKPFIQPWIDRRIKGETNTFKSSGDVKEDVEKFSSNQGDGSVSHFYRGTWDSVNFQSLLGSIKELKILSAHTGKSQGKDVSKIWRIMSGGKFVYIGVLFTDKDEDELVGTTNPYGIDSRVQIITDIYWVIPNENGYNLKEKTLLDAVSGSRIRLKSEGPSGDGYGTLILDPTTNGMPLTL
jgi:hypothetical protein